MIRFPTLEFMEDLTPQDINDLYDLISVIEEDGINQPSEVVMADVVKMPVADIPLSKLIEGRTIDEIFGLVFDVESPGENLFHPSSLKEKLQDSIKRCSFMDEAERQRWIKELGNLVSVDKIKKLQEDFEETADRESFDLFIKTSVERLSKKSTDLFLDGFHKIGTIPLPAMYGMEQDLCEFYDSEQVQTFLDTTKGKKLVESLEHPGTKLVISLVTRGIANQIELEDRMEKLKRKAGRGEEEDSKTDDDARVRPQKLPKKGKDLF